MGTESIIRRAAPWLVRKKQSHLEPLEGTDTSMGLIGKTKKDASPLPKPQKKESKKWRDSLSCVRRFFGKRSSSHGHSGDTQNIAMGLEDVQDSEGSDGSPPRVPNLPTPQPTPTSQALNFNERGDPAAHLREMKLAALEQAQIQEELWEAARLRGGCVPCSKGNVTIAPPQNSAPGLSIVDKSTRSTQAAELQGEKPPLRSQPHVAQSRSRLESRATQEPSPISAGPQTPREPPAIEGGGPPPSGQPSQQDVRSRTTSRADSRLMKPSQREHPPRSGKPSATVPFPLIPSSDS